MNMLHVCWLIDDWNPSRDKYIDAWSTAGWAVVLWHAGQLTRQPINVICRDIRPVMSEAPTRGAFDYEIAHRSHAAAADLVRFELLRRFGGGYADLDVLPKKARMTTDRALFGMPQGAGQVIRNYTGAPPTRTGQLEIRFVSAMAGDPLITRIVAQQAINEHAFMGKGGYRNGVDRIIERTGPIMVTGVVRAYARELGLDWLNFLLRDATIDHTPENLGEHMTFRYPEIVHAAKKNARTG